MTQQHMSHAAWKFSLHAIGLCIVWVAGPAECHAIKTRREKGKNGVRRYLVFVDEGWRDFEVAEAR